ncbi:hypothetical protein JNUCC31_08990 [Paenibacillus sp. JNUCC31]|uniref:hypothetical protein n=1 Tax=Paenibacillus sp. JNUCC-31 TaxID=2777983 RepID=UPI00177D23DD|nr:hypothetical protein [Paenibacillus sp. JNUCC-31]QOS80984.1 hypothetical protein JNUCC31_08990 [Paenibacillus sp. JNUCC-31]
MSVISDIAYELTRIDRIEREAEQAKLRQEEALGEMNKIIDAIIAQSNEDLGNCSVTSESLTDSLLWTINLRNRVIIISSDEVFSKFDENKDRYYRDIIERIIIEKLRLLPLKN